MRGKNSFNQLLDFHIKKTIQMSWKELNFQCNCYELHPKLRTRIWWFYFKYPKQRKRLYRNWVMQKCHCSKYRNKGNGYENQILFVITYGPHEASRYFVKMPHCHKGSVVVHSLIFFFNLKILACDWNVRSYWLHKFQPYESLRKRWYKFVTNALFASRDQCLLKTTLLIKLDR